MGRVLIYAGERLDEKLIKILKRRGFLQLEIKKHATRFKDVSELEDRIFEEQKQRVEFDIDIQRLKDEIDERFDDVPEDSRPMQIIRLVVQKVLVSRLADKKNLK